MNKEYIICAAIYYDDEQATTQIFKPKNIKTGVVVTGRRHSNCYEILAKIYPDFRYKTHQTEGFLTSTNDFVDRYKAYEIAEQSDQLLSNRINNGLRRLYSEDIY